MIKIKNKHFQNLQSEFASLMFKESYSDIKIIDGNNSTYFCHKIILRGLIPDEVLKDINDINIPWATVSTIKSFLELSYTGETEIAVNDEGKERQNF